MWSGLSYLGLNGLDFIRIEDYEIMGIRPLLIDKLNSNSISKSRIATA